MHTFEEAEGLVPEAESSNQPVECQLFLGNKGRHKTEVTTQIVREEQAIKRLSQAKFKLESLILAQNQRWRRD